MTPKHIFIVEDEAILLCDLEDLIQHLGYGIAGSASNVTDAIAKLKIGPKPDAAVIDLNLNGVASDPIADHLMREGVPIIFVSGYGRNQLAERFTGFEVLQKPYDELKLAEALVLALTPRP